MKSVVRVETGLPRRPRLTRSDARGGDRRAPLVARESWRIGGVAVVAVIVGLFAAGASRRHDMLWTGDAPFFVAVGHHPFGTTMPGDPLATVPLIRVATQLRDPEPISGLALAQLRAAEEANDSAAKASAYELLAHIDA